MRPNTLLLVLTLSCGLLAAGTAPPARAAETVDAAQATTPEPGIRPVDDAWRATVPRDADAATRAYLDRLPPAAVDRVDAYVEGGYVLQGVELLVGLAIAAVLLGGRRSARLRDWAQRVGRKAFFRDALYGAAYAVLATLLALPFSVYRDFVREHAYGLATQTLGAWLAERAQALAIDAVMTALALALFYAVLRRAGERWWLWGTVLSTAMLVVLLLVHPIWIAPLFNTYTPVEDGPVRSAVLTMARANGVPTDNVYVVDASRQTTRISANVSGLFGSAQVRLNDNLLRRTRLPEIRAVMGHELGHYVMNHAAKMLLQFALVLMLGFLFTQWAMARLLARHGARLGLHGVADVASYPLLVAVLSVYLTLATPVINTIIRTQEVEADWFGLNLAREPHGAAEAYLQLTEYRKPQPGFWEEVVFFDHPSTYRRIHAAMVWREAMGTP